MKKNYFCSLNTDDIMQIDDALIAKLEKLARIKLNDQEQVRLRTDLQRILDMVDVLQGVDTSDLEPLVYLNEEIAPWRADQIVETLTHEEALANAPEHDGTYFKVPKVVSK